MDTPLFQQDWQILENDVLRAAQQAYGPLYSSFIDQTIMQIRTNPKDLETLMGALDPLDNRDLQICSRILGVLLETFSTLQHVHKTRSFLNQIISFSDFQTNHPFQLELFIAIHAHDTLSLPIQSLFINWFQIFSRYRHAQEAPLTEAIKNQFFNDCLVIFKCENFMESLSLKKAFHHYFNQYNLHTLPGRILLAENSALHHLHNQIRVGFAIEVDLKSSQTIEILKEIPQKAFDCAWPLIAKQYPILIPSKSLVQKALIEHNPDLWMTLPETAPTFVQTQAIYEWSPITLSISGSELFNGFDRCVQKLFRKRLRRLLSDERTGTPFPLISLSQVKTFSQDSSAEDRHLMDILMILSQAPFPVISDLIVADLQDFDQLHAIDRLAVKIFSLRQNIIPSFEHPKTISESPQILDQYHKLLSRENRLFGIKKVLIGNQKHTKDKSFWWTHTQLYHAQEDLLVWAQIKNLDLNIIQSRGGSLARGSIPTRCLINSTLFHPEHSYLGLFIHPDAFRQRLNTNITTEMTLWRYVKELLGAKNHTGIDREIRDLQSSLAQHSLTEVVYYTQEQPDLIDYFYSVTPADNLSSQSQNNIKNYKIEEINSTIWFGSWSQSRLLLPFWLGFGSVLLQWDRADLIVKKQLIKDRCIESLFLVTLISLCRVDFAILKAYERELLSHHLGEVGEHLHQRYDKVIALAEKIIGFYEEERYVKNFKDDMICRSRYLTPLHALQIQMLRRSRAQWPEPLFWRECIRETMMFIGLGLQNSV